MTSSTISTGFDRYGDGAIGTGRADWYAESAPMNPSRRLQIANRIHLLLLRELGQGIQVERLLCDALYARDVLLVCDAHPGADLASLAQHFRAAAGSDGTEGRPASIWRSGHSGFDTAPGLPLDSDLGQGLAQPPAGRHWLSPARWIGR